MAIVPPNADRDCDPNKTEDEDDLDTLHCEETMRVEDEMDETEDEDFSTAPESDSVRNLKFKNILSKLEIQRMPYHAHISGSKEITDVLFESQGTQSVLYW